MTIRYDIEIHKKGVTMNQPNCKGMPEYFPNTKDALAAISSDITYARKNQSQFLTTYGEKAEDED